MEFLSGSGTLSLLFEKGHYTSYHFKMISPTFPSLLYVNRRRLVSNSKIPIFYPVEFKGSVQLHFAWKEFQCLLGIAVSLDMKKRSSMLECFGFNWIVVVYF